MKKMALVLQGGGALGAFEYGVVTALVERGWQPTATDLQTGGPTTFSNHLAHGAAHIVADGHLAQRGRIDAAHIIASGSLPPGFAATDIDGKQFWDGGLFSNTPIDALLNLLEPDEVETLPIFVVDLFPSEGLPPPANLIEVQTRAMALQYQNRFWAQYGGSARLQGFIEMLAELDADLPESSVLRGRPAHQWLMRLRALKNVRVIQAAAPTLTGGTDFSPYGVSHAYQAGRDAVNQHFAAAPAKKAKAAIPA